MKLKQTFRFLKRTALASIGLLLLISAVIIARSPSALPDEDVVRLRTEQLFAYGSVEFVHNQSAPPENLIPIYQKVQRGHRLAASESCLYRASYHGYLASRQTLFKFLDNETQFRTDTALDTRNNCRTHGIEGRHDVHDLSAHSNIGDITNSIAALDGAGWFEKTALINNINKDLIDVMVHLSPAIHSIGVEPAAFSAPDLTPPSQAYAAFYNELKAAQFSEINSCAYWQHVDMALTHYTDLVQTVSNALMEETSPMQRKIGGMWLSAQTVAPWLNDLSPVRARPDC